MNNFMNMIQAASMYTFKELNYFYIYILNEINEIIDYILINIICLAYSRAYIL